ncbi:MAG: hypothetical protein HZB70_03100 [Candidatus Berkelbacteria bacterium]|nr:MAG: hypothetical protein HZB70_03100 [Candidatus Berkelbacteria bacterium]QQG51710.1 MAG: hypothetical protein HY845_04090 [Candidatus Berkelbacteria bacterium]
MNLLVTFLVAKVYAVTEAPKLDLTKDNSGIPDLSWADLVDNAITWLATIAALAAFVGIIYSGYLMITSNGDPAQMAKAKSNMIWAIAGFLVAIFAYVIVNFVISLGEGLSS